MSRTPVVAGVVITIGPPLDTFDAVESLRATGYPALRLYVVDNGSAPAHRRELEERLSNRATLIRSDKNLGFSGGNNLAIARALEEAADYVLLLNNDATVAGDAIQRLVEAAEALPDAGVFGAKIYAASGPQEPPVLWYAGGTFVPLRAHAKHIGMGELDRGQYDQRGETGFVTGCLMFFPAAVLRRHGLLPEEFFIYGEDLDYCLTLRRAGLRLYYEPGAVCYHRVSATMRKARDRPSPVQEYYMNRNRILVAQKWLGFWQRLAFYAVLLGTRVVKALRDRDTSYLLGLWDGFVGKSGPGAFSVAP
jgi:GT2 family glycosyltransferase